MKTDRYEQFKNFQERLLAYRESYLALKRADPGAVEGLPDPDSDPSGFDLDDAEKRLRAVTEARA